MTAYRFVPWTRQGLVAGIVDPDPLDGTMQSHANIPARVQVNNGTQVGVDVSLYGPGDVIGVDGRGIVRVDPTPSATNVEPNYLAAIEFHRPDFPWMFTPASPGTNQRLRPWLVLVVVGRDTSNLRHLRARPLPSVDVDISELQPLDDSWAWAHAQVITEEDSSQAILDTLRSQPELAVSRLLCPRRLERDSEYRACLVPAFAAGVRAGLGLGPDDADVELAPAWSGDTGRIELPVYHHWEFATGPAGDFESLARRLGPPAFPLDVGTTPVFIGRADPGMPNLAAPDDVVMAEGALVGPFHDTTDGPIDPGSGWSDALTDMIGAGAARLDGSADETTPIAPPLHGGWPAGVQEVPSAEPTWVRELNLDPRARIAAGVGVGVVKAEQETLVHDAWSQVGDLRSANALVERGRWSREVLAVIHRRLFDNQGEQVFRVATPAHGRVLVDDSTVAARLRDSSVPDAVSSPAFRRMASRRGSLRRRAIRRQEATASPPSIVTRLDTGALRVKPADITPDALTTAKALDVLGKIDGSGQVDLRPIGGKRSVNAKLVRSVRSAKVGLGRLPKTTTIVARLDLKTKGVILDRNVFVGGLGGVVLSGERTSTVVEPAGPRGGDIISGGDIVVGDGPGTPGGRRPKPRSKAEQKIILNRFTRALGDYVATLAEPEPEPTRPSLELDRVRAALRKNTDPRELVPRRVASMIKVADAGNDPVVTVEPDLGGLMGTPRLNRPVYEIVAEHEPEWLLPGVGNIPIDTVAVLATNPRFVDALMAGANSEVLAELVWREYPTRRDGTPLRHFWDRTDGAPDIPELRDVEPSDGLGRLGGADGTGDVVMVVRSELLRRYPDAILSLVKATADGGLSEVPSHQLDPILRGRIDPDITFVGFDISIENVLAGAGFHFVIQQQPTGPRFGFDLTAAEPGTPATWRDATWTDVGVEPGGYLSSAPAGVTMPSDPGGATWMTNAAHLAIITMQQPVRVAIHAHELLRTQVAP